MAENIVHLVLARLPDAPPGTQGHLAVPRAEVQAECRRLDRASATTYFPVSVEHKLGIHASPTCVMAFGDKGGARGLPGRQAERRPRRDVHDDELHAPRRRRAGRRSRRPLLPGSRSTFARERVQGRAPGEKGRVAIIRHPDVRRMLLHDAFADAGEPGHLLLHGRVPRPRQPRRGRRSRGHATRRAPTC